MTQAPSDLLKGNGGGEPQALLRRLAANDRDALADVLAPPILGGSDGRGQAMLDPMVSSLVRLTALLVARAPETTLRWAVELAAAHGADDDAIVATLIAAAPVLGSEATTTSAPYLARALGYELDGDAVNGAR